MRHDQRPCGRTQAADCVPYAADQTAAAGGDVHVVRLEPARVQSQKPKCRGQAGRRRSQAGEGWHEPEEGCQPYKAKNTERSAASQCLGPPAHHPAFHGWIHHHLHQRVDQVRHRQVQPGSLGAEAEHLEVVRRRPAVDEVNRVVEGKVRPIDGPQTRVGETIEEAPLPRRSLQLLLLVLRRKSGLQESLLGGTAESAVGWAVRGQPIPSEGECQHP
mmetsp:Transcript_53554/g.152799  ORF Transcript_53554/g.152799 Transcript_53554/m.152799 type:complete len:217 (+) Transcript_53554:139-789(+)